ncbi:MAG: LysM peptidoglycan-binding domain-containing protein [Planctomycetes bacterium]|nr:LysM peptidoglycan-binding domain-containing protein [Planctomycetota bacterium]
MSQYLKYGLVGLLVVAVVVVILWKPGARNEPASEPSASGPQEVTLQPSKPPEAAKELPRREGPADLSLVAQGTRAGAQPERTGDATGATGLDGPGDGGASPRSGEPAGSGGQEATPPTTQAPAAEPARRVHVLASGETLSAIARCYYNDPKEWRRILEANPGLTPERLPVGKEIVIPPGPAPRPSPGVPVAGDFRAGGPAGPSSYHVVAQGESLYSIAQRYYGNGNLWRRIKDANPDLSSWNVRAGMRLVIPGGSPR